MKNQQIKKIILLILHIKGGNLVVCQKEDDEKLWDYADGNDFIGDYAVVVIKRGKEVETYGW